MTGHRPPGSADQARQAPEHLCEESLIRRARWQMQTNLLFEFHHPNDEADRQQTQRIELQAPPRRAAWHRGTQGPQDPVGTGVQKQSHLVGACRMAGGAVSREVALEGLDVVFHLPPPAVGLFIDSAVSRRRGWW